MVIFGFFAFILMFKFVLATFPGVGIGQNEELKEAFYVLFREVAIVVSAAIIFEALDYYELFNID
jgi:hypothetical protein